MEDKKRDYQREYENERSKIKRYTVRVHKKVAEEFDAKLKKEGKNTANLCYKQLINISKKIKKILQNS